MDISDALRFVTMVEDESATEVSEARCDLETGVGVFRRTSQERTSWPVIAAY